jgi:hypothetical protein
MIVLVILDRLAAVAIAGALLSLIFALRGAYKALTETDRVSPPVIRISRSARLLLLFAAVAFTSMCGLQFLVRKDVEKKLAPEALQSVTVEGASAVDVAGLVDALHGMKQEYFRRSHTGRQALVHIYSTAGNLTLALAQDSDLPNEYWVMVPAYWVTSTKDIGRIRLHSSLIPEQP